MYSEGRTWGVVRTGIVFRYRRGPMGLSAGPIVLAHPLTQRYELGVSPLVLGVVAFGLLFGVAQLVWQRRPSEVPAAPAPREERDRPRALLIVTRVIGVGLLVLAISAGLLGRNDEQFNIAPALIVGAGWPSLVLASLLLGRVWPWIDPFDSLARVMAPLGAGDGGGGDDVAVWPAVGGAVALVAYLTVWPGNLWPRTVGSALLLYVVVTLAGCLALGRRTWLDRAEVFGLLFGWLAAARHVASWAVPAGAAAVLSVLAGGFAYGLLRDSHLMANFAYGPDATRNGVIALTITVVAVAVVARAAVARHPAAGRAVTLALTIAAGGLALALALGRNRFTTSLQMLPILATDPFGAIVDRGLRLNPEPFGVTGLRVVQVAVLGLTHVAAAVAAARRGARDGVALASPPALLLTAMLLAVGVAAIAAA